MLKNYLKVAIRNIFRHKLYSFINIAGLAVGMSCTILILLWVNDEISYDRFHENGNNLYRIAFTNEQMDFYGDVHPAPLAEFLEDNFPEIIHATHIYPSELKLSNNENSFSCSGKFVHEAFFDMFSFPAIAGNTKEAFSDPISIVLSEKLAHKLFGDSDPLGKTVKLEDNYDFTVTAVLKDIPQNSHIQFEYLLSVDVNRIPQYWDNKCAPTYVQLQAGMSPESVNSKIMHVYNIHNIGSPRNDLFLQPLPDVYLYALGGGGRITYVYIFTGMAIAILLMACMNFMNLSTACSEVRFKEVGIRKVMGSSRPRLMSQFMVESVILTLLSLFLAIILVELVLPSMEMLMGKQMEFTLTGNIVLGLICIAIFTGLLSGSYPALYLSSFKPVIILNKQVSPWQSIKTSKLARSLRLRAVLVVLQFTLSIFFIICSSGIKNQLDYINNKELGFNKDQIVVFNVQGNIRNNVSSLKNELLKNSSIEGITMTMNDMSGWGSSSGVSWEGKQTDDLFDVGCNWVDHEFVNTFEMEMSDGRFFSADYPSDMQNSVVINETLLKRMEIYDPIGKALTRCPGASYEDTRIIIGVIKDYHTESLHKEMRPFVLVPSNNGSNMFIRINPDNISVTLGFIENKVKQFDPNNPFIYRFLDAEFASLYRSELITGKLTTYITLLAIFISCLGLFGLVSFTIRKRNREISIRKVLGASVSNVVHLLTREFIILIIISNVIAWPIAYIVMKKWFQNFAYQSGISLAVFVFSAILTLAIAFITISFRAIKAALTNPVDAIRHE
jgi:putative ABC transport system permease protein